MVTEPIISTATAEITEQIRKNLNEIINAPLMI
jgi:hypothetical protein